MQDFKIRFLDHVAIRVKTWKNQQIGMRKYIVVGEPGFYK